MYAAVNGKLDCLEHLVAKGAKLDATSNVSAAPPAAPSSPLAPLALRLQTPPARPPPPLHPRVCGRRRVSAGQEDGAAPRGLQRPRALRRGAAQGGGRRAPQGQGARWRRGPRREGVRGLGGEGRGWGLGGRGPCVGAAPPLRAARSPPPAPSAAAASTSAPSPRFPVGRMATRRWTTPRGRGTRRSSRSSRTPPPSQRRSARVRVGMVSQRRQQAQCRKVWAHAIRMS